MAFSDGPDAALALIFAFAAIWVAGLGFICLVDRLERRRADASALRRRHTLVGARISDRWTPTR